jgi:hypothetical protein
MARVAWVAAKAPERAAGVYAASADKAAKAAIGSRLIGHPIGGAAALARRQSSYPNRPATGLASWYGIPEFVFGMRPMPLSICRPHRQIFAGSPRRFGAGRITTGGGAGERFRFGSKGAAPAAFGPPKIGWSAQLFTEVPVAQADRATVS